MAKYGDGYIGVLAGSFEYFHNSIKMFNNAIEKSSRGGGRRTRKDFDLTILTYPYLVKSNSSEGYGGSYDRKNNR